MGEFKTIETQEAFDVAISERLNRQKEAFEAKMKALEGVADENKSLKEQLEQMQGTLDENKTQVEAFNSQIEALNGKIKGYELKDLKTSIAMQHGIPYELAGRLVGEDEESLTNDAKSLSEMLGHTEPLQPLKSIESQSGGDAAYKQLLEGLHLEGE